MLLPYEVWLLIASYLHDHELRRLISVNRCFFEDFLGRKYKELKWSKLDEEFIYLLTRLQSPIISIHVRKLYIRAWFIAFLLKRDALYTQNPADSGRLVGLLCSTFPSLRLLLHSPGRVSELSEEHLDMLSITQLTSEKVIRLMISAIQGMTNVWEFHFEWTDLPLTQDTKLLLSSIGAAFGKNLRRLTLHAHVLNFKELHGITTFVTLEELELHFDYSAKKSSAKTKEGDENQELLDVILPFIERSGSVLRSLLIYSSSSVDLSNFFAALPAMPHLQRFGVGIPFEKTLLSDSSALIDFLKRHSSSLLHAMLAPNLPYSRNGMLQERKKAIWDPINDILLDDPVILSNLETLEIPFVSLEKTIPLLKRSANTLLNLSLTNHILSFDEVMEILTVFSHRKLGLKSLDMELENFTRAQLRQYVRSRYTLHGHN